MVVPGVVRRAAAAKLAVVASIATATGLGVLAQRRLVNEQDEATGLVLWGITICVFLFGMLMARTVRCAAHKSSLVANENAPSGADTALSPHVQLLLLLAVLAIASFFRLYKIDTIPRGLNHDSAWNGLHAINTTPVVAYFNAPYALAAWGRETLFHELIAVFQWFLGPTQLAIQLAAVTVGIATVAVFYLLLRRLFDTRLALIATFLLGVSGWHVTMSRTGWRNILVPLLVALVFYFLVRAIQEQKLRDFVLAGLALGLSLNTYDAARVIPFIVVAYIIYEIVRDPSLVRKHYLKLGALGAAFAVAFAPLGWYAMTNWDIFTNRGNNLWIGNQIEQAGSLQPLATNLKNALLMFNFRANGADFFVREPLLDIPVSVFFPLGLVLAVIRWRQPGYFLLLLMLVLTLAMGVVSTPNGNRVIATVLPVTVFAAVFLFESWRWLREFFPQFSSLSSILLAASLFLVGFLTYDSYLGSSAFTQDRQNLFGYYPEATRVGRYIKDVAHDYEVHVAARNWPRDTLTYLSYHENGNPFKPVYTYTTVASELLGHQPTRDRGVALVIEATRGNAGIVNALRTKFPNASVDQIFYPDKSETVIALSFRVPPGSGPRGLIDPGLLAPGAATRDTERLLELERIASSLLAYREQTGSYPDTMGDVYEACLVLLLDTQCVLPEPLSLDDLATIEMSFEQTYWFESDGTSFTLYVSMEGPVSPSDTCTPSDRSLATLLNLFCYST